MNGLRIGTLEKWSSTAAMRAFRRGALSKGGLLRASKFTNKTMAMKHLGIGANQIATHVIDPKFGESVMKTLKRRGTRPGVHPISHTLTKEQLRDRESEYRALMHLKSLSRGKEGVNISQMKGRKGPAHFQEYQAPNKGDTDIRKRYSAAKKEQKALDLSQPMGDARNAENMATYRARQSKYETEKSNLRDTDFSDIDFDNETKEVMDAFKKRYPKAWDMRRGNQVGGRLIDFEPGNIADHLTRAHKTTRAKRVLEAKALTTKKRNKRVAAGIGGALIIGGAVAAKSNHKKTLEKQSK
jgi:hypothetical protein